MPTIMRIGPYRFFFYSNEKGEPPHVHVDYLDGNAKFWLEPILLASNKGIPPIRLREIEKLVREHRFFLRGKYDEYHNS